MLTRLSLANALGIIAIIGSPTFAQSQIVPDGTLGAERSIVTPNFDGQPTVVGINGGAIRGANLFHSFLEFNIAAGQEAYFVSPNANIQNILARVTGGNPSQLLGIIGVSGGNTNLFFINPNGIIFGADPNLAVGGSFVATTANAIVFGNQGLFSASALNLPPLLTVNPSAFLFNQIGAKPITLTRQSGLEVPPGRSLLLLGGDVQLESGVLFAPGGRIELGGLADVGAVGLLVDGNTLGLNFPNGVARADVSLTGTAFVSVASDGGGSIAVNARNLNILGRSQILAGIGEGLGAVGTQAGDITVNATDEIKVAGAESGIENQVQPRAVGKAGSVNITAGSLFVTDGAAIEAITKGEGDAGNVNIQAATTIYLGGVGSDGSVSTIGSTVEKGATGKGGEVSLFTGSLNLTDGAQINTTTYGTGNAGNVTIHVRDTVSFDGVGSNGPTGAFSSVGDTGVGNGGSVNISAGSLFVTNGAAVNTDTNGRGDAGNVNIIARDIVSFGANRSRRVSSAASEVNPGAIGNGGNIYIKTRLLSLANGALLGTSTYSQGNAGNLTVDTEQLTVRDGSQVAARSFSTSTGNAGSVTVTASDLVELSGISADNQTPSRLSFDSAGTGNAGDLRITTGRLIVRDGAQVLASTSGSGRAGTLDVNASDFVQVIGTSPDGQTLSRLTFDTSGSGNAGDLRITTGRLLVQDGAQVSASTSDIGRAGTLSVKASDSVQVIGTSANGQTPSRLTFDTSGTGNAGVLTIDTKQLIVRDGAQVSASTSSVGQGGILQVTASDSVQVIGTSANGQNPSRLTFDTSGAGNAGDLTIDTKQLIVRDGAQVSASTSSVGQGGILNVNASDSVEVSGTSANGQNPSRLKFETSGAGSAGELTINTGRLVVQNGGQVSVSGAGAGASGDLDVKANSIFLNNQGKLIATTASGEGGNIRLRLQDSIVMRYNSEISTEAGGTGNGGNINIEAGGFVLAILSENSDIVANAFEGRGGNARATATGVFSFRQFRGRRTPESDFKASSELGIDGVVSINTRDNPQLAALPQNVLNNQIVQGCASGGEQVAQNEFIVTGRGGLPDNPSETLSNDAVWTDLRPIPQTAATRSSSPGVQPPTHSKAVSLVEAQGWVINHQGQVVLTASAPTVTSQSSTLAPSQCHVP